MKYYIKKGLLLLFCYFNFAMVFGQFTEFKFSYSGFDLSCNPFYSEKIWVYDKWKSSHGTPTFGNPFGQNIYKNALLKAEFTDFDPKGEGLYIDYDFDPNYIYDIEVSLAHYSGDEVGFKLLAANGISESTNNDCKEDKIPGINNKKELISTQYVYNGPNGQFKSYTKNGWSPDKKYSQLWVLSFQDYYQYSGSFLISSVVIFKRSGSDNEKPSAPSNLKINSTSSNEANISWSASNDNVGVTNYQVYVNGKFTAYTDGLRTYDVKDLTPCSTYSVYVRALDAAGNVSNPSNTIEIRTEIDDVVVVRNSIPRNIRASKEIKILHGFTFVASEGDSFSAKISENCEYGARPFNIISGSDVLGEIENEPHLDFDVIPNPSNGHFFISNLPNSNNAEIKIYNTQGKLVYHSSNNNSNKHQLDLSNQPKGVYFLNIIGDFQTIQKKLIIN